MNSKSKFLGNLILGCFVVPHVFFLILFKKDLITRFDFFFWANTIGILLLFSYFIFLKRMKLSDIAEFLFIKRVNLKLSFLFFPVFITSLLFLFSFLDKYISPDYLMVDDPLDYFASLMSFIGIVISTPILEEIFMRLFLAYTTKTKNIKDMIFLALIFVLLHGFEIFITDGFGIGILRFLHFYSWSFVIVIIFFRTMNLSYCIIMHSLHNLSIFVFFSIESVGKPLKRYMHSISGNELHLTVGILFLIMITSGYMIQKSLKKHFLYKEFHSRMDSSLEKHFKL